ncbi:glycosyltransferase family 52 [Psychrobacter jeotgali]|uniref:glycosyltransferase family 52 n=1 Tax=Psychrobacter jeotgali TaxID=179010 RepID=UPI00191A3865|nr:glycosyltransferase family 52 [Psychrobacter jeotgali]
MSSLLIIRTPFQAFLAQKIIEIENILSYDLIYFTEHNSEEDIYYFRQLSSRARNSDYYYVNMKGPSILSSFVFKYKTLKWYKEKTYQNIICASIDALFINSLIKHYSNAKLITMDDGAANIYENGIYFKEHSYLRIKVYHFLLQSLSLSKVKSRIDHHYTIYDGKRNIVPHHKLIPIKKLLNNNINKNKGSSKTYFIGAPFEYCMNPEQIKRLENLIETFDIDYYIKHPRENKRLNIEIPYLNKNGRIAEEAILVNSKSENIILIGWFSSVLLNMGDLCLKRIVLLARDSDNTKELTKMSRDAGCEVILF